MSPQNSFLSLHPPPFPFPLAMEDDYYQILGVNRDASAEVMKKAYHAKARKVHPDKNLNDPDAALNFQVLAEAYKVLSNPKQRAAYDKYGKAGVSGDAMVDPSVVFGIIFGSDVFEEYVGELAVGILASIVNDSSESLDNGDMIKDFKEKQISRQTKLVQNLKDQLTAYVKEGKDGYLSSMMSEAARLSEAGEFAKKMLQTIGYVYAREAGKELGKRKVYLGLPFAVQWMQGKAHSIRSHVVAAEGMVRLLALGQKMKMQEESDIAQSELMLDHLWKVTVVDIERTLSHVCREVLAEKSEKSVRRDRAEALLTLGKVFKAEGKKKD